MSLFLGDPFLSNPMESMRRMMDQHAMMLGGSPLCLPMLPFGNPAVSLFPHHVDDMFANLTRLTQHPMGVVGQTFASTSVMTMSTDASGRPQVYQATSATRQGPNGVKETHVTLQDSRSGVQQMEIGRHIHDRAHIVAKKRNRYTGEHENAEQFVNIDESDTPSFHEEFRARSMGCVSGVDGNNSRAANSANRRSMYAAIPYHETSLDDAVEGEEEINGAPPPPAPLAITNGVDSVPRYIYSTEVVQEPQSAPAVVVTETPATVYHHAPAATTAYPTQQQRTHNNHHHHHHRNRHRNHHNQHQQSQQQQQPQQFHNGGQQQQHHTQHQNGGYNRKHAPRVRHETSM